MVKKAWLVQGVAWVAVGTLVLLLLFSDFDYVPAPISFGLVLLIFIGFWYSDRLDHV